MKIFKLTLPGLAALAVCGAAAGQGANERGIISLSDPTRLATVHLGLIQGSIAVRGTDRKDVLVEAHVDDDGEKTSKPDANGLRRIPQRAPLSVEEENNRVAIAAGSPNRFYKFTIEVPAKTNLEISTVNGGEVTVDGVDGELEIGNVNGGITLTRVGGSVVAHTTNGGVHVTMSRVAPQKPMAFTTLNGDVDVSFPASTKANLKLRSDQGEIFTDFELKLLPGSSKPTIEDTRKEGGRYRIEINKALSGTINGGGPDFEMRSFTGNIFVRDGSKGKPQ
ncbi:MAG TPA: DUF4097 family beta strand repeat-containing protein [Steroidobacteraceae bacterium]|nr:DUF4097 family beta strand repeat-containing protein [Steroidobacteraceae bacterium]